MDTQDEAIVLDAIRSAAVEREGRLTLRCANAFAIARECGVPLETIGRLCNEHRIKIIQCQLGCFP